MTTALTEAQRDELEGLVQWARRAIEGDLADTVERRFGIHHTGLIEDLDALSLHPDEIPTRDHLLAILEHLRSDGTSSAGAVDRLVREAAFTHLNRLVAVRVAEAIGLLPETVAVGTASQGFRDFCELVPALSGTEWARFWTFLQLCADELATDVPALFDPRNPLLELSPSEGVIAEVVGAVVDSSGELWSAPDTLGWAYQFFNTDADRRKARYRSDGRPKPPGTSEELAVRNQFFTPSYVVQFLVHNGLGARLAQAYPELADQLDLLVEPPEPGPPLDLADVSALDPACGSGHFLLGVYDVLERAWELAGTPPADAAPSIVSSLWGIDIDVRATQIAQAAIIFRARRHCRGVELPVPRVICARSLPLGSDAESVLDDLPDDVGRLVRSLAHELEDAPILGPLLKVEQRLDRELRDVFGTGATEGTLAEAVSESGMEATRHDVFAALERIADSATLTAAERLFVAEARDAVRFVQAMTRRYTTVVMNPPFGEPVPATKDYLRAAYPWIPTRDYNLLAAFVGRGRELAEPDGGTCGAITSRAGMFQKTFEDWRQDVMLGGRLVALVDLGNDVMEQALVEAAAYVIVNDAPTGTGTVIRLLKDLDRASAMHDAIAHHRSGRGDHRVFVIDLHDLHAIPGSPLAYWMGDPIRRLFQEMPALEGAGASARQGLATGDDFRFVRAFWEVDPSRIGHSTDDTQRGRRWVPFAKGGEYSPFWADVHLLVDWERDGERIRGYSGSRPQNVQFFFRGGLTWPPRTNAGLGMRLLPQGTAFAHKGCGVFPTGDVFPLLGWLRSRLVQAMIDAMVAAGSEVSAGGASRSYEVGLVQKLPWLEVAELAEVTERLARRGAVTDERDETTRRFVRPVFDEDDRLDAVLDQLEDGRLLDDIVNTAAQLDDTALAYLDDEIGPYPLAYAESEEHDDRVAELYQTPISDVIKELIEERGGSRAIANLTFVADRRIEVIAHGLQVNPRSIVRVVRERELSAPGEYEEWAERLLSYLVGLAFGRWDVRAAWGEPRQMPADDLMAEPAAYPPGMLLGADGLPATAGPADYPLDLPPDALLLDEPGHEWDIERRVRAAAAEVFDSDDVLDTVADCLMNQPSVAGLLRRNFFRIHLGMYTKSRRKAPIYWQLQVPSRAWGIWLYAPRLTREVLFAVVREAERRQKLADQRVTNLQRDLEDGTRSARQVAVELEAEQQLSLELNDFRAEARRVAELGWDPDLDDGILLNAALLADLFPAWPDAARAADELTAGGHDWSTAARFAGET